MIIYVILAILILLLIGLIIYTIRNKDKKFESDYRTFFIIGVTWLPLGIIFDNPVFYILGAVFLITGLVNKDKWKKQKKFSQLSKKEQNIRLILIGITTAFLILGIAVFFLVKNKVI